MTTDLLSGIRIIDLTNYVAGPYCTKLFADLGADVIKIERPERGDGARWLHPFVGNEIHPEKSAIFLYLNTNKRSVVLNLKSQYGIDTLKKLVKNADIIVENFRPGTMANLGISYPVLERLNPRIIMTSISNFGQEGPYRDWKASELTLNALSGMMDMTGEENREPLKLALSQVQYTAGVAAAIATLAVHRYQRLTGYGQHIDISILEPFFHMIYQQLIRYGYQGVIQERGLIEKFPWIFATKDGWVHASRLQLIPLLIFLSDSIPELKNLQNVNPLAAKGDWNKIGDLVKPWFQERDRIEATEQLQFQGINASPIYNEGDLLNSPQLKARDYFTEAIHPLVGRMILPGRNFFSEQIPKQPLRAAPLLGQHTREVLDELATSSTVTIKFRREAHETDPRTMPLTGVRILSVEHWAALPHATKFLASLGAEIIVIESPARVEMDPKLRITEITGGNYAESARNKLGVTIDLSKPQGINLFKELVKISDAVVDNFTPRVMSNLGLDYQSLCKVKPDIITLSISGFGRKGPWYLYRGYSITAEATSGLANLTGYINGNPVRPGGTPPGDIIAALHATFALLAAIEHRRQTGKGADIDISMPECITSQLGEAIVLYSLSGKKGVRMGNRDLNAAPSGCYPCSGNDNWITITVSNEEQWKSITHLMGNPDWTKNEKFSNLDLRIQNQDELDQNIAEWTRPLDKIDIMTMCQQVGVPAGAVLHLGEIFSDEQNLYRGSLEMVNLPQPPEGPGPRPHLAPPWRLSKTPSNTLRSPRIELGEDNKYVFSELLKIESDTLAELERNGVISRKPTVPPATAVNVPIQFTRDDNYKKIIGLP